MAEKESGLTLDRPAVYQIRLPGVIDSCWTDWDGELTVAIEIDDQGAPITVLTGELDQAGLHGLLRRLYMMGLPILSVQYVVGG